MPEKTNLKSKISLPQSDQYTPSWLFEAVGLLDDGTAAVLLTDAAAVAAAELERGFLLAWKSDAALSALLCAGGVPPGESGRSLGDTRPEVARDCS